MAVIVFGAGTEVEVTGDAAGVLASLASAERGEPFAIAPDISQGYCPLEVEDGTIVYVDPRAVALVREGTEIPTVEMAYRRTLNDAPRRRPRLRQ